MLKPTLISSLCLLLLSAVATPVALAVVVFDNGGPDSQSQRRSDFSGSFSPQFQTGVEFVLGAGLNSINGVEWWGSYADNAIHADDFTIRIFAFTAGSPDTTALVEFDVGAVARAGTGLTSSNGGFDIYRYSASFVDTLLTAGDSYLLSIVNDSGALPDWGWSTSAGPAAAYTRSGVSTAVVEGLGWGVVGFETHAFNLSGEPVAVPSPPALSLLAVAMLAATMRRRTPRWKAAVPSISSV